MMLATMKQVGWDLLAIGFGMLTILCGLLTPFCFVETCYGWFNRIDHTGDDLTILVYWFFLFTIGFALATYLSVKGANTCAKKSEDVRIRAPGNTVHLPASDSLVRASAEPLPEPKAVLLRAAQETETPPEQLLRAAE